jgi:hypothetical protein
MEASKACTFGGFWGIPGTTRKGMVLALLHVSGISRSFNLGADRRDSKGD